jgi:hypothetical protein
MPTDGTHVNKVLAKTRRQVQRNALEERVTRLETAVHFLAEQLCDAGLVGGRQVLEMRQILSTRSPEPPAEDFVDREAEGG